MVGGEMTPRDLNYFFFFFFKEKKSKYLPMLNLESGEHYSHLNFYSFNKHLLDTICAMHFAKLGTR